MRKISAVLWSALFLVIGPGTVAGLLPWAISGWKFQPAFFGASVVCGIGVLLIVLGLIPLVESFARFALKGLGTPVPILPTRHLVVTGFYRHVRNPMYVGVVGVILGQALLFGDIRLLAYVVLVWLCFHAFVLGYEEPTLRRQFGDDYAAFCKHVPRWIPRLKPWDAPEG
jgi:protein-S-isoprenylcysteine O-methyltransferase Ste14